MLALIIIFNLAILPASATASVYRQFNGEYERDIIGVRPAINNSYSATLDGYSYCRRSKNGYINFGAHNYSIKGNCTESRFRNWTLWCKNHPLDLPENLRKTCKKMEVSVQAVDYLTGNHITGNCYMYEYNTYALCNNQSEIKAPRKVSVFSTLHNYYSPTTDLFVYPTVVDL